MNFVNNKFKLKEVNVIYTRKKIIRKRKEEEGCRSNGQNHKVQYYAIELRKERTQ